MNTRDTQEQLDRLKTTIARKQLPPHVETEIYRNIKQVISAIDQRSTPGAYSRFLSEFVGREHDKRRRGDRSIPLCSCDDPLCAFKSGRLPRDLRAQEHDMFPTQSMDTRLTQFLEHHPEAHVLREASNAWGDQATDINMALFQAEVAVRKHATATANSGFDPSNLPDTDGSTSSTTDDDSGVPASTPSIAGAVDDNPEPDAEAALADEKDDGDSTDSEGDDQ